MRPAGPLRLGTALALVLGFAFFSFGQGKEEKDGVRRFLLPVYGAPDKGTNTLGLTANAGPLSLRVEDAAPLRRDRCLLLIFLPVTAPGPPATDALGPLIDAVAAAAQSLPARIRVGIPVLDGILSPPLPADRALAEAIRRAVGNFLSETAQQPSPERVLDIIRALLQRTQAEEGASDCLIIGGDRPFADDASGTLAQGAERLILDVASRMGSTLHGILLGSGALGPVCRASGGLVYEIGRNLNTTFREVLGSRSRGFLVAIEASTPASLKGRFPLRIYSSASGQPPSLLRGPAALWYSFPEESPPELPAIQKALEHSRQASEAEKSGNFARALEFWQLAAETDTWSGEYLTRAARLALKLSRQDIAAQLVDRAVTVVPLLEEAIVLKATRLQEEGKVAEALGLVEAGINRGLPENAAVIAMRARLLSLALRLEDSRREYERALPLDSGDPQIRAEYACLLRRLGENSGAEAEVRLVLGQDPQNLTALLCASELALARNNLEEARQLATRALSAHPDHPDAYAGMARLESEMGQLDTAQRRIEAGLAIDPRRRDLWKTLAELQIRAGRLLPARQSFERLLELDPGDSGVLRQCAQLMSKEGDIQAAAEALEQGAARAGEEAYSLFRDAGGLRERRGDFGQAILNYRAMLRSLPPGQGGTLSAEVTEHIGYLTGLVPDDATGRANGLEHRAVALPSEATPGVPGGAPSIQADPAAHSSLYLPGGHSLLARALGLDPAVMREPDALARVFTFILEANPRSDRKPDDNPLRQSGLVHLRNYRDLMRYLTTKGILAPGFNPLRGTNLVFPFAGGEQAVRQTRDFLNFFGVSMEPGKRTAGMSSLILSFKQDAKSKERQELLRHLGVDLQSGKLVEFRVSLRDEYVPSVTDEADIAAKLLGKGMKDGTSLLEQLLSDPPAMRLYVALAASSQSARSALLGQLEASQLRSSVDILAAYGAFLDCTGGEIAMPGSLEAWEALLGLTHVQTGSLLRSLILHEKGRALRLYAAMSPLAPAVQRYLAADAARLKFLYLLTPSSDSVVAGSLSTDLWRLDVGRLLRLIRLDSHGLYFPFEPRLGAFLFSGQDQPSPLYATEAAARTYFELPQLVEAFGHGPGVAGRPFWLAVEVLEFFCYLQAEGSWAISDEVIALILENPADVGAYLDLVWDVRPTPAQLAQYLRYCRSLGTSNNASWQVNRMRTSQSVFFLLGVLCRRGAVNASGGRELFGDALAAMGADDEGVFSLAVAEYLSERLLPLLRASGFGGSDDDTLVEALAGPRDRLRFVFEGIPLEYGSAERAREQFLAVLRHQSFVPLGKILSVYRLLQPAPAAGDATDTAEKLLEAIAEIREAQFQPEVPPEQRRQAPHAPLEKMLEDLAGRMQQGALRALGRSSTADIAARLHTELGVTLLSYCYGISSMPEVDLLTFDPVFTRKHDFADIGAPPGGRWSRARLKQGPDHEAHLAGSLSGLGHQLNRLEAAQGVQSFGRREGKELIPSVLSGFRAVPPVLWSERAQEYVALTTSVGRQVAERAVSDTAIGRWLREFARTHMLPPRRERIEAALVSEGRSSPPPEWSPSELFFLGQAYVSATEAAKVTRDGIRVPNAAQDDMADGTSGNGAAERVKPFPAPPEFFSPALAGARQLAEDIARSESDRFGQEVRQYGMLLSSRIGLTQLSLAEEMSYEELEAVAHPNLLYERICDLKIRIAEINYALGLPAGITAAQARLAIRDIFPATNPISTDKWRVAMEQIGRLDAEKGRRWIEELMNEGILVHSGAIHQTER